MNENIVNENNTPIAEQEQQDILPTEETEATKEETTEAIDAATTGKSDAISLIDGNIAENIILYGVPGCGKSYTIKESFCNDEDYIQRVVFHQDYTYSDFVGQILPKIDAASHTLAYVFTPGPFTTILKKAVDDAEHMYFLVIEEINRGNAPAIFGDIFQLLDRNNLGESVYDITNFDIARYVYGDEAHMVKIPSNLTLLATMNTADQNVFTLDTAFKRRWRMCSIKNDVNRCKHKNDSICGTNVSWKDFVIGINKKIVESNENMFSNEDKRLGAYFVQSRDLDDVQLFAQKVLMYLWNDVFRYNRNDVFKTERYKILEELIDGFYDVGFGVFKSVFDFDTADMQPRSTKGSASKGDCAESIARANEILSEAKAAYPDLYTLYESIYNDVKARIPTVEIFSNYNTDPPVCLRNNPIDHKYSCYAVIKFQPNANRLQVFIETSDELTSGPLASVVNSTPKAPRKYMLNVADGSNLSDVADAIVGSYNALKK